MKRTPTLDSKLTRIAFAFAGMLGAAVPVQSGQLTIANEPLGAPPGLILPNVMFILDSSGSMGSEYMPDFVIDADKPPATTAACADTGDDDSGKINGLPDQCKFGDPPFNSPDFNTIYYNPGITYLPGVNLPDPVSGAFTDMPSQTRAFTSDWTKVQSDPYLNPATTADLAAGYRDRVWCANQSDAAVTCFLNTAYQYPDDTFKFGETTGGSTKTRQGSPYYYRMQTAQYCTTEARGVCVSGSSVVHGTHTFMAPEYCTKPDLVNCAAGAAVTDAHTFTGPRWCKDKDTLTDCQAKKLGDYIYAKHLGVVKPVTGPFAARANSGTINITGVNPKGGTINDITIGSASVITQKIEFGENTTAAQLADLIRSEINKSADFTADPAGGKIVTISRKVKGKSGDGEKIFVSSNSKGTVSSKGRITLGLQSIPNPPNTPVQQDMTTLSVNFVNLLCPNPGADIPYVNGVYVEAKTGRVVATLGTNTNARRAQFRLALKDRIDTCKVGGYSVDASSGIGELILVAPVTDGFIEHPVARSGTLGSLANIGVNAMGSASPLPTLCAACQKGVSTGDVVVSAIDMGGGQDELLSGAERNVRVGVGAFSRTDIVATVNAYAVPAGAKRTDCAGTSCTYEEEITNFANWHAYYRSRMLMMKTSVGRAFISVDSNYRVGFITTCPVDAQYCSDKNTIGKTVDPSKYLRIADFTPSQKYSWYKKLYDTNPKGGTPLREALSRVGQIYAGALGKDLTIGLKSTGDPATTDDPMTRSCQPNFALLSTDGYWNQGAGRTEKAEPIGNPDGVDKGPYSLKSQGVYDGTDPPESTASSDTLADVALYYYVTDLRPDPGPMSQNNVPTTAKDIASHQHMVTFTLGLGIDGELSFDPKYETATSGDFFDIKQGTRKWPVPAADSPSALDDLWHAAVSGRGVFYSVKDPAQLTKSLDDLRNQLEARLGAGAAAATSNLQPVAGDNFAFTASFTTSSWTGDLKARTIDLSTGVVSTVSLWSAAALLDNRQYTTREIFTFDPADLKVSGVPGDGSGNLLRHFCPTGTCTDGGGLDADQMSKFATSQLKQSPFPFGPKLKNATNESLVNYLRGDRSYEYSSPTRPLDTDLYRPRDSMMGDIVNAQPAYVKRTPFSYTDIGFADFRKCTEGIGANCGTLFPVPGLPRRGTVYSAANDGMLHAFETDVTNSPYFQTGGISTTSTTDDTFTGDNTGNGVERWAYIPGLVLPDLHKLANDPYTHTYLTDGTPQVGDIDICKSPAAACSSGETQWRTILVGGLNSGGIGYYALDVTDPQKPKGLWEFGRGKVTTCYTDKEISSQDKTSDCHLGFSYGNAVITKLFTGDKRWVVIVASGYNNTVGTAPDKGDGKGYLYILDALTGNILFRLTTGVGSDTAPSGLSKINGWTDDGASNNTARAIYGGDLEGNLWRFKLDSDPPSVTLIAELKDGKSNRQPITVKPELANVNGERVIVFGTGKFLELADKTPPESIPATVPPTILPFPKQSIYALKDFDLADTSAGPLKVFNGGVRVETVTELEFVDSADGSTRTVNAVGLPPPAPPCNPPSVVPPACSVSQQIPELSDPAVLGWRIDLKENGERVNVDPVLQLGTLVIGSNVPTTDSCSAGGFSFLNFLDVTTGSFVKATLTSTMASVRISSSILVGVNVIMLPGGALKTIGTLADETRRSEDTPVPPKQFIGKRVSWRELFVDQ